MTEEIEQLIESCLGGQEEACEELGLRKSIDNARRIVLKWEIIGMVFIILVGSLFHFTYEMSGNNPFIGTFSAVNESTWEHLKLLYFPLIFFAVIEYCFIREQVNNFVVGKLVGFIVGIGIIIGVFYGYTALTGIESLIIDIFIFIGASIIAQYVSYQFLIRDQFSKVIIWLSWGLIVALGVLFVVFTFYPPDCFLFIEP